MVKFLSVGCFLKSWSNFLEVSRTCHKEWVLGLHLYCVWNYGSCCYYYCCCSNAQLAGEGLWAHTSKRAWTMAPGDCYLIFESGWKSKVFKWGCVIIVCNKFSTVEWNVKYTRLVLAHTESSWIVPAFLNRICAIVEFGTKLESVQCGTTSTQRDF